MTSPCFSFLFGGGRFVNRPYDKTALFCRSDSRIAHWSQNERISNKKE